MSHSDNRYETTILESKAILVKDQNYEVVLTNSRILLTGYSDKKQRSIELHDIQKIETSTNDFGDPVLILSVPSVAGEIKKVILRFSRKNFPDPLQVSALWSLEISRRIQPAAPGSPASIPIVSPVITQKASPDIAAKKGLSPQVFCVKCGKKFVDGSLFCNVCGTKIIYPEQPFLSVPGDDQTPGEVLTPKSSTGNSAGKPDQPPTGLPKEISPPVPIAPDTTKNTPVIASPPEAPPNDLVSRAPPGKRKPAIIAVSVLACIILVIAVIIVVVPALSPGFNLTLTGENVTSPGENVTSAGVKGTASAAQPPATTKTVPKTTKTTTTPTQTTTTVHTTTVVQTTATPVQTSTTRQATATPTQITITDVVIVPPSFTTAVGDPYSVFVAYPSLFNDRDSAGIEALLSENMKSHYPVDTLNTELAKAQSNGYSIEKIQATEQTLEDTEANLVVTVTWKTAGSSSTSTPRVFFVNETNQWKLDSLIVSPAS